MTASSSSARALGAALCALNAPEDIARLDPAFSRALGREFDLAALAGRLCPVLLENGDVAIFAVKEFCVGDAIDEVERMVRTQG